MAVKNNAERIDKALENIKICDPAIGSGAFPVGMMNEIVRARIALVESGFLKPIKKRTIYEYKRQAIQNSIYGVDIESGAVEIAKLRLWLSLVVDEEDIENIKALPNLDYKIVQGNSLLSVERNLFNEGLFRQLEELKPQYFNETRKSEKKRLKKEIDAIINELTKDGTFDFEIYFSEVFLEKGGFDVIIANPPYVGQKGNKEKFQEIKKYKLGKLFHQRRMDLFYFFFHLALNILSNNGKCAFITTNYFLTATYADKLRKDLKERSSILQLINFNELKIFESAQGQHNIITILEKNENINRICDVINVSLKGCLDDKFAQIIEGNSKECDYKKIQCSNLYQTDENYILISDTKNTDKNVNVSILEKIQTNNNILGKICKISCGIQTGADKVTEKHISKYNSAWIKNSGIFVLNKTEYKSISQTAEEKGMLKPFFKNSDIKQWYTNNTDSEKLIYYTSKKTYKNIENIKKHLAKYKILLVNRNVRAGSVTEQEYDEFVNNKREISYVMIASAMKRGDYYCISYARDEEIFNTPKIVCPQRSTKNTFGYNEVSWYAGTDVFIINTKDTNYKLKYILSLLNSKAYFYWLYHKGHRKGEILELIVKPLSEIPIKLVDEQTQNKFVSVVDKILAITQTDDYLENQEKQDAVKEYEKQIDIMVYKLYALTYDEVLYIDKNFTMPEQEYNNYQL